MLVSERAWDALGKVTEFPQCLPHLAHPALQYFCFIWIPPEPLFVFCFALTQRNSCQLRWIYCKGNALWPPQSVSLRQLQLPTNTRCHTVGTRQGYPTPRSSSVAPAEGWEPGRPAPAPALFLRSSAGVKEGSRLAQAESAFRREASSVRTTWGHLAFGRSHPTAVP